MSDWQVGDLALCVDGEPFDCGNGCHHSGRGVSHYVGRSGAVEFVYSDPDCGCMTLRVFGVEGVVSRFRKIKPDAEPCEEEFTVLIKRMKPAKVKQ